MALPHLLMVLLPILTAVGFLVALSWGLSAGVSLLAGLGMGGVPVSIVAALAWLERRRR